jgi:hypothetical protein
MVFKIEIPKIIFLKFQPLTSPISGPAKMAWLLRKQNGMPVLLVPMNWPCYTINKI